MDNKLILTFVASLLVFSSAVSAVDSEMITPDRPDTDKYINNISEAERVGFFEQAFSSLAFTNLESNYQGGEDVYIVLRNTANQDYRTADSTKVVTLYKCADSTCDTPAPISQPTDDSCEVQEWWPEYDDCIAQERTTLGLNVALEEGDTVEYRTNMEIPTGHAQYVMVGTVWKDGETVTEVSKKRFVVGDPDLEKPSTLKQIRVFFEQVIASIQGWFVSG